MTPAQVCKHYPRLYHMGEEHTWRSVRELGLLSTTALLDKFEVPTEERYRLESCRRRQSVPIHHPKHGTAVLRDQKPLSDSKLMKCLVGMDPQGWYRFLNARVFFWPTRERILTLLSARAYRGRSHTVITVDTASFLEKHADRVKLSPINSGAVVYRATPRGLMTFRTIEEWPDAERPRSGALKLPVAEFAVDYSVPDIADVAVCVEEMRGDRVVRVLWRRKRLA